MGLQGVLLLLALISVFVCLFSFIRLGYGSRSGHNTLNWLSVGNMRRVLTARLTASLGSPVCNRNRARFTLRSCHGKVFLPT